MHDVLIAGAGPVGLLLACELGLAGCDVLVLEQDERSTPWKTMPLGMRGLSASSAEVFHRRGLLKELLIASGVEKYGNQDEDEDEDEDEDQDTAPAPRSVSHFAGMMLDAAAIDTTALPYRLPGPVLEGLMTSLEAVETVLTEQAAKVGVHIRRGAKVSDLRQGTEGVTVRAGDHEHEGRWLVGCDGGRSTVRGLGGFEFTGTEPQFTGYTMLATVADPDKLQPGFSLTPTGMYLQMPTPGHIGIIDYDRGAYDRGRPPTVQHLQSVLRHVSGTDVTLEDVLLVSTFTDRAKQTTSYQRGRVLLAGDAAHIHSPLGAQGLNTGIADAMNLGWKLAATVHGHAPDGLLGTYTRERHPVGAQILDWTRAQSAVMRPGPHSQALQALVADLLRTRDGTTYVYNRTSGSSQRYDLGSTHPLVGRNVPDLHFTDGTHLGDHMHEGQGIAVDFTPGRKLAGALAGREDRIRYVAGSARNEVGCGALLVRPDGVVAWADGPDPDADGFARAAAGWFGSAHS
ncbi:2-polyprenyl-6-methoxyphenol hydroxylase-like FAD-dependent oxidoreductase [Streptomyces sp. SAI-135]|uniref:FAD-dependent monooxygenase n=1 Tax=unclassified Streptomyces TaxID=2593676 RepID=UPI0024739615|nr:MULTISPECIES: FAD-dependent monooxygenase [unclassified Streptomyces]MDH6514199.1 2-polyprenyl-6-methoxyphenol hydroxylase-like FAD-dependent oxidoreductase [Streptomyces sp. SAI-090]MDH6621721.1 2-polyprenyl-6-methoxyphenol hydroxylase-like FAD-dependent oxidoreductase [Streptomyces sp. SAI-135]